MDNEKNFETYLYFSDKKLSISVQQKNRDFYLYKRSIILDENQNNLQLGKLDEFLNSNIFKVEKLLKEFIKNVTLIIDHKEILKITLSLKKKNYGKLIDKNSLNSLFKDARNQIKENYNDKIITHMIINKYFIDGEYFLHFPENLRFENLCVDIDFICLSEDFIKKFELLLSRYQIKIQHIISANYARNYFKDDEIDVFLMCKKIKQGHNKNEILFIPKKSRNRGFFEKFFNFFN
tara:strand:- start:301 stop:1005 length:705 start_codon:yes stop_codon:yes gene_type:complete